MDGPVAIRYQGKYHEMEKLSSSPLQNLKWEILKDGRDVVIFAVGSMIETALQSARILERQGLKPTIINARVISL